VTKCNFCMDCIPVCPTGSIDEWRVVVTPYSLEDQYGWSELPEQEDLTCGEAETGLEAIDDAMARLLAEAHAGRRRQAPGAGLGLEALGQPVYPGSPPRPAWSATTA
jgi:benzoyl-CoA 2,3-epoxidase subunit A